MNKAILLHIDGCRVDALQSSHTPNIDKLIDTGAWTLQAQTDSPPLTLPVHFSIFTSTDSASHGVLSNSAGCSPCPALTGLFEWLKLHGRRSAMYYNWEFLRELTPPGFLDSSIYLNPSMGSESDMEVMKLATRDILAKKYDFSFIYLGSLDESGHTHGFGSNEYHIALERTDLVIGYLLDALDKSGARSDFTLLLESDHGGIGHHHQEIVPEVMTIPWIINGPTIQPGKLLERKGITVMDTAPTLCHCLEVSPHPNWKGKVISEAFISENQLSQLPN